MLVRAILLGSVLLGCATAVHAQAWGGRQPGMPGRQPGMPVQIQMDKFEATGKIEGMQAGRILMSAEGQQKFMIIITPQTHVEVSGTATVDALKSGMFVQFRGEVDNTKAVKEKVTDLTITDRPAMGNSGGGDMGAGGGKTGHKATGTKAVHKGKKGAGGAAAGGELVGDPNLGGGLGGIGGLDAAPGKDGKGGAAPIGAGNDIVGMVKSAHGGKLTINTGSGIIRCEVAEDAKISIAAGNPGLARPGDSIVVKGMSPRGQQIVQAQDVKIELSQPLGEKKKGAASAGKSSLKQRTTRTKKGAAPNEAPAEGLPAAGGLAPVDKDK